MMTGTLAISAVAFVAVPFTEQPLLLAAVAFVLGVGLGCGQPLTMILSFNAAPQGRAAEAIAMRLTVSYGAHVVIPPAFGAVGAALGLALGVALGRGAVALVTQTQIVLGLFVIGKRSGAAFVCRACGFVGDQLPRLQCELEIIGG